MVHARWETGRRALAGVVVLAAAVTLAGCGLGGGAESSCEQTWESLSESVEGVTAADFVTTMLMRWSRNMPKPATEWAAIAAYVKRMKARPSFKVLYEREGLTEWA